MTGDAPEAGHRPRGSWLSRWDIVALALLVVGVSLIHLDWIRRDTAPMPYPIDAYVYLTKAIRFADGLRWQGFGGLWSAIEQLSLGGRPPLYQLLSLPFILVFGRSLDAALMINVVFTVLLLISVYAIGKALAGGKAGLLAAVLVASYPPVIHVSHSYIPHFAVAACAALSIWLLLRLIRDGSTRAAWLFGASLAFGLLMHPNFVWFLVGPTVVFGAFLVLFRTAPRRPRGPGDLPRWLLAKIRHPLVTRGLVCAALIAVGIPLGWYVTTGQRLWRTALRFAAADTVSAVGFPEVPSSFWWYAQTAPGAVSNIFSLFAIIGLVSCVFRRRLPILLLGFALASGYTALSLVWVRELVAPCWWHFLPVLPFAAALTGAWIVGIGRPWLARSLSLLCVSISVFIFSVVTWGVPPWARPLALALGAPLDSPTCASVRPAAFCPGPARREHWPVSEILEAVLLDDPRCESGQRQCLLFLVVKSELSPPGGEWPTIKDALFSYHLIRDWPSARIGFGSYYGGLCGAQNFLISDYVFYFEPADDTRAGCFAVWSEFLRAPPPPFEEAYRRLASFELPNGRTGTLVKRIRPLTPAEVRSTVASLARRDALFRPAATPGGDG